MTDYDHYLQVRFVEQLELNDLEIALYFKPLPRIGDILHFIHEGEAFKCEVVTVFWKHLDVWPQGPVMMPVDLFVKRL